MERLRELRLTRGMTQTQVGDLIGVSCVTIGRYEAGEREPSNAKIAALADYFGVSVDYLMGRDEGQPQPSPSPADRQRRDVEAMLRAMSEADLEKVYDYARFITRDKK